MEDEQTPFLESPLPYHEKIISFCITYEKDALRSHTRPSSAFEARLLLVLCLRQGATLLCVELWIAVQSHCGVLQGQRACL